MAAKDEIRMLEGCLKAFLLEHLRRTKQLSKDDSIINEFPINPSSRRVDIVIVGKTTHAFEIKSEADSLHRLQGQVEAYLNYFDKVTVVTASKHVETIVKTTPSNVAVWEVRNKSIRIVRHGKKTPINDRTNLIRLMRVPDLSKLLRSTGLQVKPSPRSELVTIATTLSVAKVRQAAIAAIKGRYAKTTLDFWRAVGRRRITPMHLVALSPTSKEREAALEREKNQSDSWDAWMKKAQSLPDDIYLHKLVKSTQLNPFGPIPAQIKKLVGSN